MYVKTNDIKLMEDQGTSNDDLMLWVVLSIPLWIIVIVLAIYGNIGLYNARQRCTSETTASIVDVYSYDSLKAMGTYSDIISVTKYVVTYAFIDDNSEMITFSVNWGTDSNYEKTYNVIFNPDNSSEYFFGNNENMKYSNQVYY
jgi:hypothetical protein